MMQTWKQWNDDHKTTRKPGSGQGKDSPHGKLSMDSRRDHEPKAWYVREMLQPELLPSFKAALELLFSRIMQTHMLQRQFKTSVQPNTCNFFLLPAYSPDILPIELVRDLVCQLFTRDLRPAVSKDESLL
ncbi:hypothetical protein TNCV_1267131 [Trichonephila clavipes]|nr:hypothetical protein TNCV_1267131 [Trichonephila clavipes]